MISLQRITENGEALEELKKEIQKNRAEESEKVFKLAPLPYREVDLETTLSPQQIDAHYNVHHRGYVDRVNKARGGQNFITYCPLRGLSMNVEEPSVQHDASQAWNHDFYWNSMSPNGGGAPSDNFVMEAIEEEYESFTEFKEKFVEECLKVTSTTGSAWCWLVLEREMEDMKMETEIKIVTTTDCRNPYTTTGKTPLCCIDLWEHAYYIDYGPNKEEYISKWLGNLINWDFVSNNFHKALIRGMMGGMAGSIGQGPMGGMLRMMKVG